jgi:hypothetical protein
MCATFQGLNADFDADTKTKMVGYCQTYFTSKQNPTAANNNPACIVCTDSTQKIMAPGVMFNNKTKCIFNSTAAKTNRLRFLSGPKSYSRFLQNGTNTTNNTPAVNRYYTFNVCPIQDLVCASDTVGTKTYAELVADFANTLKDAASFVSVLGKPGSPITGTPSTIKDDNKPVLNFTTTAPLCKFDNTGGINWNATVYNLNQAICWWMVTSSNTVAPTMEQINACVPGTSNCGNVTVTPTGGILFNAVNTSFSWNTDLYIWGYCANNIPNSAQFTNVTLIANCNPGANPNGNNNNNNNGSSGNNTNNNSNTNGSAGNNTGNSTNNTNKNGTGSTYISIGIALFMSLLFIL